MTNQPQLPQDVEEFIAEHARDRDGIRHRGGDYLPVDDLRAWMSGHVRVPVEQFDLMKETLEMIVAADWAKWEELSTPDEFVRWAKSRANHALRALQEGQ